ncbi:MAG: alpha/beta hydrolase-fold protein, partial [Bacteroidota bacterium]
MKNLKIILVGISLLLFTLSASAQASEEPVAIGFKISIESKVLSESRPILIRLPIDYEESEQSYPVIYVMDGYGHFHHTTGTVNFLSRNNLMPKSIVVAIPNTTDRTRDLTPPEVSDEPQFSTAGGADNTLKFIETELMPYINKTYRTTDYKVLIGHSFGGLFAIHAMLHHEGLFNAHLAISPSLWWNDQDKVSELEDFLAAEPKQRAKLYMTLGNEGGAMKGGVWKFAAVLGENNPSMIDWEFVPMEKETHGTVPHRSTYKGLEAIFADWRIEDAYELYKEGGLAAIEKHYEYVREVYGSEEMQAPKSLLNVLGLQLLGRGQPKEAVTVFEYMTKRFPKASEVYQGLGAAHHALDDNDAAIEHYKKALDLNPGNEVALKELEKLGVKDQSREVKLTDELLASYVGKYQIQEGMTLEVTKEGDYIYGQPTGQDRRKLIPKDKDAFYLNGLN